MDLFSEAGAGARNLLPYDGIALYYGPVMSAEQASEYFALLMRDIAWRHDEAVIMGKKITTRRKVAWYADAPFSYTYSGVTKTALAWTAPLLALKALVEASSGETYNSCLLNLYHDGSEGMAWHSDAERDLKRDGAIGSLSLGAARKFAFKHKKTSETLSMTLEHGSLLVMKGATQTHWLHRLPPSARVHAPRINLTFRTIETQATATMPR